MGGKGEKAVREGHALARAWNSLLSMNERNFLLAAKVAVIILFTMFYFQSALSPDETSNLLLGRQILQLDYGEGFFHRLPLVPSLVALLYLLGLGADAVRFLVPLGFMILAVPVTYLLSKEVTDEKTAKMSVLLLLLFPMFWRWGTFVLSDIPLMVLLTASLYYFIKGLRDQQYFFRFGISLGLASLTKLSFIVLPIIILLYLAAKRRDLLRSKRFWSGILISLIIFSSSAVAVFTMGGSLDFGEFIGIAEHVTGDRISAVTGSQSITYPAKLALYPLLVFLPFAFFAKIRMKRFMAIYAALFIALILLLFVIRLRYFSPLYPIMAIFTGAGFLRLRKFAPKRKKILDGLFVLLALASFMGAVYLISLDSGMLAGADMLVNYTSSLEGMFASDYLPDYLNMTNDVISDKQQVVEFFGNFSDARVDELGVDYIVLSVYGEWGREPNETAYFHPALGPVGIPFITRPYSNGRVPNDYTFRSDLYDTLQASPRYTVVKEIYSEQGQLLFIVYMVG